MTIIPFDKYRKRRDERKRANNPVTPAEIHKRIAKLLDRGEDDTDES